VNQDRVREVLARQARERARQQEEDARTVLATPAGRRLVMAALAKSGVWSRTGCADGDAVRLAYACGRRDGAADLLGFCNRCAPERMAEAMRENTALTARWNEEIRAAEAAGGKGD
jgi:hypothetical protein